MTASRATDAMLDALHSLLAGALKDELTAARVRKDEKGNPVPIPGTLLQNVMRFLKDNGIDAPARSERLTGLAEELAAIDLDEAAEERLH